MSQLVLRCCAAASAMVLGLGSRATGEPPALLNLTPGGSWYSRVEGVTAAGDVVVSSDVRGSITALRWNSGTGLTHLLAPGAGPWALEVKHVTPSGYVGANSLWVRSGPCCGTWGEACDLVGRQGLVVDMDGAYRVFGEGVEEALCESSLELASDNGIAAIGSSSRICHDYPDPGCVPGRYLWNGVQIPFDAMPVFTHCSGDGHVWVAPSVIWRMDGSTEAIDFSCVAVNHDGSQMMVNRPGHRIAIWNGGDDYEEIDTGELVRPVLTAVSGNWQWMVLYSNGVPYIMRRGETPRMFMRILQQDLGIDPGTLSRESLRVCNLQVVGISDDGSIIAGNGSNSDGYSEGFVLDRDGEAEGEPWCVADFDQSGFVDLEDFDAFVEAFEAGSTEADVDFSCFVDFADFDWFVRSFEEGC